jgi:transcription termination factor Rho
MPKKPKSSIYCGAGITPSSKKPGTEDQCINMHQVRKYGLKKVDENKLKESKEDDEKRKMLKKIDKLTKETDKLYDNMKITNNYKAIWPKIKIKEQEIKKLKKSL